MEQLYCNVAGTDQFTQPYDSSQYYQQSQPFDSYQQSTQDPIKNQSIELKSRQKYIDDSTMSILTTTELNPFLSTDFDDEEYDSKYDSKYDNKYDVPVINNQPELSRDLSSIEEDLVTEDTVEEYDVKKNPFLYDY